MLERKELKLKDIRLDGGTQVRASIREHVVCKYAADMKEGSIFPPLRIFFDGIDHWLADGFHRYHAALRIGVTALFCEVDKGTSRDAILFASGANKLHGEPMDNADKRKVTMMFIEDFEWGEWSNAEIARQVGVSAAFVGKMRGESAPTVRKYTTPTGKIAEKRAPTAKDKPAAKAQPSPKETPADPVAPEDGRRQELVNDLIAQNEELNDRLAVAALVATPEEKGAAEGLIKQLREELRIMKLEMAAVKSSRDKFQLENAQLKKQIAMQQRQIKSLEG